MKIGINGGSFNPIHRGHIAAAKEAARHLGLDALYLIPAGIPPHKQLSLDAPDGSHRMAMTQLAAEQDLKTLSTASWSSLKRA